MPRASIVLGDHPHFAPLRSGEVAPEGLELEFVDVEPTNRAFAPMLREGRYDISEMAITVFLQAVEVGKPVSLLPVVAVGGFHHGSIYCNRATSPTGAWGSGPTARRPGCTSAGCWPRSTASPPPTSRG